MSHYTTQLERAKRYLGRLERIYKGMYPAVDDPDYLDDEVISFFMHCYHVRDWMLASAKTDVTVEEIDAFIDKHRELKICADFCNGEKHCRLERTTRTGGQPHLASRDYEVTYFTPKSGVQSTSKAKYRITLDGQFYDALELASRCVELWQEFALQLEEVHLDDETG